MRTEPKNRHARGLPAWAWVALIWLALPLAAGEEGVAPWSAVAAQCQQAKQAYQAALAAVEQKYPAAAQSKDPAAIMEYVAARKAPQDAYRAALQAAAAVKVRLAPGVDWQPAAAALGQAYLFDGQYSEAAAEYTKALLPPWQAGADPSRYKDFLSFLDRLPADQLAYLRRHQSWCCYRLGTLHERAGTPKLAVTLYRNALSLERRPRYLLALALASTLHADYDSAQALLSEASTATKQSNAIIEYHLGYCLEKLWQLDAAAAAYDRAAALVAAVDQLASEAPADPTGADDLGAVLESGAPAGWNLDLPAYQAQEAARRVRATLGALTAGQKDSVGQAAKLFAQAQAMNQLDLEEKFRHLKEDARDAEEAKLLTEYEALMSQAVVAFPRFTPALVKSGIIKVNRDEPEQALILFQSALEADRDEPAALIYYAQTALQSAGQNIDALDQALNPPPLKPGDPPRPPADLPALQKKFDQAVQILGPLPEIGKRLAHLLDKHAIGFEICALAEWEQVHANSFRKQRDAAADRKLLIQAHRDYLQARRRGGRSIDLFEKLHTDGPNDLEHP